ncbi:MAG: hypothetical protein FJX77_12100 [Armatimonadetes bacterium]|nr:hypothetical protein [Armatimonadota bacterium]MBM3947308.1 hypothetical protein [SAR202 cluster bacterium]
MRLTWFAPAWRRRDRNGPSEPVTEDASWHGNDAVPLGPAERWEAAAGLPADDFGQSLQHTRVLLQIEEDQTLSVLLDGQNIPLVLEATQKIREFRERERSGYRPVLNFGETGGAAWEGFSHTPD